MGIQINQTKDVLTLVSDSNKILQKEAKKDYLFKYFQISECCNEGEDIKHHYLINKYFSDPSCSVSDYINKKLSGELEYEYRKRKALQKLDTIEFKWECDDMYDDKNANCCDWKAIEW